MAISSHASEPARTHGSAPRGQPRPTERDATVWSPPSTFATAGGPPRDAVALFERGMAALQRQDFGSALRQFDQLEARFPSERALIDRVRVYGTRCRRALAPVSTRPQTLEERLTEATAALNTGDDVRVEQLVAGVLDQSPGHEYAHYLLAAVHARRGAVFPAVVALQHAIGTNPELRVQARHEADFDSLRGHEAFEALVAGDAAHSDTRGGT